MSGDLKWGKTFAKAGTVQVEGTAHTKARMFGSVSAMERGGKGAAHEALSM